MKPMRRIVLFDRVTADGYYATADGNLDWAVPDEQQDKEAADSLGEGDTILFGRRTYDMFEAFWPNAVDDSATSPDPHADGRRSTDVRAIADWINNATKIVFSRTRKAVTWKNSRLLRTFDTREVEAIKAQPGKDIIIFGSGSIVSQLTEHDLIDEYQLLVTPILLGGGQTWLTGVSKRVPLTLVEARTFESGNVKLRYTPAK